MRFASNRHRVNSQAAVGTRLLLACAVASALSMGVMPLVNAQTPPANTQRAEITFDVPAGALDQALVRFGRQSGLQFSINSSLTRGKRTAGLKGTYPSEDGLRALLAGSGLTFRFTGPRNVVIEPMPETGDARVLGPLRIEGATGSVAGIGGINGSTDPTATENSGTYAASATAFVSKSAQSVLDTPQTVSVVSRQQMSDQNINDFASAMAMAPGITVNVGSGNQNSEFFSRGFYVEKARVDGGAPIRIGAGSGGYFFNPDFDMAMYDHVEILRGADGLYSGYGSPGGVVNLVRKRPLAHNQVLVEFETGSWNNYRTVIDATGPLGFDDRLRGRAVFTYQDKEYFYDLANDSAAVAYGILEADVSDDLVVRAGLSLTRKSGLPWQGGLPRFQTGEDLGLPRDTCLCYIDANFRMTTKEFFLQADYRLSDDWSMTANLTRYTQRNELWVMEAFGGVNPETGKGYGGEWDSWRGTDRNPVKNAFDATLQGKFELFGKTHRVTFGGNYSEGYHHAWQWFAYTFGGEAYRGRVPGIEGGNPYYQGVDVLNFDPRDFRYRPRGSQMDGFWDEGSTEYTASMNLSSELTDKLTLNVGLRYSYFETHNQSHGYCRPYNGDTCRPWLQDENGEWYQGDPVPVGYQFPSSRFQVRDVDRNFAWPPTWSLVYKLGDQWSVYGSYADSYLSNGSNVTPEKEVLPPTTGFNAELGANYLSEDEKLTAKVATYYINQEGFPEELYPDEEWNNANMGDRTCCFVGGDNTSLTSYGLDLELAGRISPNWQVSASYNYNKTEREIKTAGYRRPTITRSPEHMMKLWAIYQSQGEAWWQKLNIGGGVSMQTSTFDSGDICTQYERGEDPVTGRPFSNCISTVPFDFTQGYYAVYSARVGYQLNDRWQIGLSVNNLFDKRYYARTATPAADNWYGDPRNYTVVLRGKF